MDSEPTPAIDSDLMARAISLSFNGYGPLAIPTGQKQPPPVRTTGEYPMPEYADWFRTVESEPHRTNLGVRLPPNVVGIDVDAYDEKGGRSVWEQINTPTRFPETVVVSARYGPRYDGISGIRLYRLPEGFDQSELWGAHDGVEILRGGHRYLMAPGSLHPTGSLYQAVDVPTRSFLDGLPPVAELPLLDAEQASRLTRDNAPWASTHSRPSVVSPSLWETSPGTERPTPSPEAPGGHGEPAKTTSPSEPLPAPPSAPPTTPAQTHPQNTPEPPRPHGRPGKACSYLQRLTQQAIQDIENYDSKHDRMTTAVWAILQAEAEGHQGANDALAQLGHVFINQTADRRDGGTKEATNEYKRSIEQAKRKTTKLDPILQACCNTTTTHTPELWTKRPWLTWCNTTGLNRGISRYALAGALLARASAELSPEIKIESPIGHGRTELNLYILLLGASGTSKTTANSTTRAAWNWTAPELRLGSGEGLAAAYTRRENTKDADGNKTNNPVRYEWRRYAWIDEYGSLISVKARAGATIASELRTAWSGERLGMDYRAEEARLPVDPGTYRLSIAAGIQPTLAAEVFAGSDVGDLQRWLWFTATDPELANTQQGGPFHPLTNNQIKIRPEYAANATRWEDHTEPGLLIIPTTDQIKQQIWNDHINRQAGNDNDHDSHRNHQRLRLAGILALIEGQNQVENQDWELAGELLTISDQTRHQIELTIRERTTNNLKARGQANATISAAQEEHHIRLIAEKIWRAINRHEHDCSLRCATQASKTNTDTRDAALDYATDHQWLTTEETTTDNAITGTQQVLRITLGPRQPNAP